MWGVTYNLGGYGRKQPTNPANDVRRFLAPGLGSWSLNGFFFFSQSSSKVCAKNCHRCSPCDFEKAPLDAGVDPCVRACPLPPPLLEARFRRSPTPVLKEGRRQYRMVSNWHACMPSIGQIFLTGTRGQVGERDAGMPGKSSTSLNCCWATGLNCCVVGNRAVSRRDTHLWTMTIRHAVL